MIKRILSLFIALLLTFSCAAAEDYNLSGLHLYGMDFTINYPWDWSVDVDDSENTGTDQYCGLLYSPTDTGLNVEIYKYYLEGWADYTMLNTTSDELASYIDLYTETGSDYQYSYVDTIYTGRDGIPFLIFSAYDEYGHMYVAETMMDGWFITLYGYAYIDGTYTNCRNLFSTDLDLFKAIVQTYHPLSK